ncbi:family 43 glycosylhydrolase [Sphingomonas sp.]|uniref:family 43 glycosylhydrolase n=1 Tax=Sphingomonas sp. TaxID=28214 RepID=UPI0031D3F52F
MKPRAGALLLAAVLLAGAAGSATPRREVRWNSPGAGNPLLPGYFADPSIVRDGGRWYIFATVDPWGDDRLGLWTSENGRDWTFSQPNWPTKQAATSPTSGDSKVWAPSVVRAADGRWYMYVSVGSEVWVGSAPSPAGPWADANGGKPLIPRDFAPKYHMIDAEAFVDDDGQAYLYWGSGLNWVNGHCFVVKLKPDMVHFDGQPRDVTPGNYFEGPFMVKEKGRYLLTYSDGNTTKDSYKVRYAVGNSPMGPFVEAPNSPILQTDAARQIISPGHHAIFADQGRSYILYHRQALPFVMGSDRVLRQVAVDRLTVQEDGLLARVAPSHDPVIPAFAAHRARGMRWTGQGAAALAADDNYATAWRPAPGEPPVLTADLGSVRAVRESRIRPAFVIQPQDVRIEASVDGRDWHEVAAEKGVSGSPITLRHVGQARFLRLTVQAKEPAILEWSIF